MIEIISAEKVARETVKSVIEEEISMVNEAISNAKGVREKHCHIYEGISRATEMLLEDAGYDVERNVYETDIDLESQYNEFIEDYDKVKEIADEIGIKVIKANRNIIDPNWEPPRKD